MTGSAYAVETLGLRARLRRTPGVSIYLLLAALAIPLAGGAILSVHRLLEGPSLGLFATSRLTVDFADARWGEVQRGDRILYVDGYAPESVGDLLSHQADLSTGPVTVGFERGGRRWEVQARADGWASSYRTALWSRVASGIALVLIGLVAFAARPGARQSWLLLAFCYVLGTLQLLPALFFVGNALYAAEFALLPLGASLGLQLFSEFPRRVPWLERSPRRAWWLYVPGGVIAAVNLVAISARPGAPWDRTGSVGERATWIWVAIAAVGTAVILHRQFRRARREGDVRALARYRAVNAAVGLGLVAPSLLATAAQLVGSLSSAMWLWDLVAAGVVLFGAVTAYALIRHNALEVDRFTAAVIGYVVALAVLGVAYAGALYGIPLLLQDPELMSSPPLVITLAVGAAMVLHPLHSRIRRRVADRFVRERVDASQAMQILQELTQKMHEGHERAESLEAVVAAVRRALGTEHATIWTLTEEGDALRLAHGSAPAGERTLRLDGPLAETLWEGGSGGVTQLAHRELPFEAQQELWSLELAMAAPIRVQGLLLGFLGVGRKTASVAYANEELVFLRAIAAQLGFVLDGATEDRRIGRYRLVRRLGTGGAAEVYLAAHLGPGGFERKVALKRPLPHLADEPDSAAMFLDEARIAATLNHDNIAQIHEVHQHAGRYYIAMEYVDGPTLRDVIRAAQVREEPPPVPVAAAIVVGVLRGLHFAHRKADAEGRPLGIVHRDVSPRNVLLNREGRVKLVDFGIARAAGRLHTTQTGLVRGTLPYMAPEQHRAERVDARTDVYSVAAMLYELLTLVRPHPDGPGRTPPRPPSELRSDLPSSLDTVVLEGLAYRPGDRHPSGDAMRVALLAALAPTAPADDETVAAYLARTTRSDEVVERSAPDPEGPTAPAEDESSSAETRHYVGRHRDSNPRVAVVGSSGYRAIPSDTYSDDGDEDRTVDTVAVRTRVEER